MKDLRPGSHRRGQWTRFPFRITSLHTKWNIFQRIVTLSEVSPPIYLRVEPLLKKSDIFDGNGIFELKSTQRNSNFSCCVRKKKGVREVPVT